MSHSRLFHQLVTEVGFETMSFDCKVLPTIYDAAECFWLEQICRKYVTIFLEAATTKLRGKVQFSDLV